MYPRSYEPCALHVSSLESVYIFISTKTQVKVSKTGGSLQRDPTSHIPWTRWTSILVASLYSLAPTDTIPSRRHTTSPCSLNLTSDGFEVWVIKIGHDSPRNANRRRICKVELLAGVVLLVLTCTFTDVWRHLSQWNTSSREIKSKSLQRTVTN